MIQERIGIFDSLRGYCALWVACVHLARFLTLHDRYWIPDSSIGVEIFFILSGYIIANLLERDHSSYRIFLFRRFFRLAPVLTFFSIVCLIQTGLMISALEKLDIYQFPVREQIGVYATSLRYWYLHLPAHITMLHGLLDNWLTNSSKSIILQAWSISVEWQFYICAPFLLLLVKNNHIFQLFTFLLLCLLLVLYKPIAGVYFTDHILSFLAGIITFLAIHHDKESLKQNHITAFLLILTIAFLVGGKPELGLWSIFIFLAYGNIPLTGKKIFYGLFDNTVMRFMGRISYSFFLCHMLTIYYAIHLVTPYIDPLASPEYFYLAAMPLAILLGVGLSTVTYYTIEQPAIRWSKRITTSF